MPRGDGTGPRGMGSMSGRGFGFCSGNNQPGFTASAPGRGAGMAQGGGRGGFGGGGYGRRNQFYATGQPGGMRDGNALPFAVGQADDVERRNLENQVQALKAQLDMITSRLSAMEGGQRTTE